MMILSVMYQNRYSYTTSSLLYYYTYNILFLLLYVNPSFHAALQIRDQVHVRT